MIQANTKENKNTHTHRCAQLSHTTQHAAVLIIFPPLPPDNHHSSDAVYQRRGGHTAQQQLVRYVQSYRNVDPPRSMGHPSLFGVECSSRFSLRARRDRRTDGQTDRQTALYTPTIIAHAQHRRVQCLRLSAHSSAAQPQSQQICIVLGSSDHGTTLPALRSGAGGRYRYLPKYRFNYRLPAIEGTDRQTDGHHTIT